MLGFNAELSSLSLAAGLKCESRAKRLVGAGPMAGKKESKSQPHLGLQRRWWSFAVLRRQSSPN